MILREHTGPPPRRKHFSALPWLPRQHKGTNSLVPDQVSITSLGG
jgi:hypothetical protein